MTRSYNITSDANQRLVQQYTCPYIQTIGIRCYVGGCRCSNQTEEVLDVCSYYSLPFAPGIMFSFWKRTSSDGTETTRGAGVRCKTLWLIVHRIIPLWTVKWWEMGSIRRRIAAYKVSRSGADLPCEEMLIPSVCSLYMKRRTVSCDRQICRDLSAYCHSRTVHEI